MKYELEKVCENIRKIRKGKNISQENLIDSFKTDYNFSISRNTLSKIENGEDKHITFEFLLNFAKWAECDIGYLLGEYKEKTQEVHQICLTTGLTEDAIEKIIGWHKNQYLWCEYVSSIITSAKAKDLFSDIESILHFSKQEGCAFEENNVSEAVNAIDMQCARQWYLSKTFTDIIEEMSASERLKAFYK